MAGAPLQIERVTLFIDSSGYLGLDKRFTSWEATMRSSFETALPPRPLSPLADPSNDAHTRSTSKANS